METRIFDRRGRTSWEEDKHRAEDQRVSDRRRKDRRIGDRRIGERRDEDVGFEGGERRQGERRKSDRRQSDRRHGDRRTSQSDPVVRDLITDKSGEVYTVSVDATVAEAAAFLAAARIGVVVAIDSENSLLGILSERDIVRGIGEKGAAFLDTPVSEAMTRGIWTCGPGDSLFEIIRTMSRNRIRHMPVLDTDSVVGMVSTTDLLEYLAKKGSQEDE